MPHWQLWGSFECERWHRLYSPVKACSVRSCTENWAGELSDVPSGFINLSNNDNGPNYISLMTQTEPPFTQNTSRTILLVPIKLIRANI
jgi:hypothetical protein